MKGKKRISSYIALFMAVLLCLTSAVPVSAFEVTDEIVPESGEVSDSDAVLSDFDNNDDSYINNDIADPDDTGSDNREDSAGPDNSENSVQPDETDIIPAEEDDTQDEIIKSNESKSETDEPSLSDPEDDSKEDSEIEDTVSENTAADQETAGDETVTDDNPVEIREVNPLYEGIVDESEIPVPSELQEVQPLRRSGLFKSARTYNAASPRTYTTIEEAAAYVRERLEARDTDIVVYIDIASSAYGGNQDDLWHMVFDQAKSHTGKGTQGDYLSFQYGGTGGRYGKTRLEYTPSYYTTAAQEEELGTKISQVLQSLDLNGCSDEIKCARIYKYITDNVVYDRAHLNNTGYKLQYTAYAAMMNGTAVCQGYSVLFYRMALQAGIDSRVISGKGNGGAHAWNIVRINGKYYNLDATWDCGKAPIDYAYYLNNTTFDKNHVRDKESNADLDYTSAEFNSRYPMASSSLAYPESEKKRVTSVRFVQGETVSAGKDKPVTLDVVVEPADAWDTYVDFSILTGATIGCSWAYDDGRTFVTVTPEEGKTGNTTIRATARDGGKYCDCKIVFRESTTALAITKHPSDVSGKAGDKVTFSAAATGEGLTFRWQVSEDNGAAFTDLNSIWQGYNSTTLTVPVTDARNGFKYRLAITDVTGTKIYSNPATLTVTGSSQGGSTDTYVATTIKTDSGQPDYLTGGYSMEVTGTVSGTNRDVVFTKVKGDGVKVTGLSADAGKFRLGIDASECRPTSGNTVEVVVKATVKNGRKDNDGKPADLVNEQFYTVKVYPVPTLSYSADTEKFSYTAPVRVNTGTTGGIDDSGDKDNQTTAFTACKGVLVKVWKGDAAGNPVWSSSDYVLAGNSASINAGAVTDALYKAGQVSGDYKVRIYPCAGNGKYNRNVYAETGLRLTPPVTDVTKVTIRRKDSNNIIKLEKGQERELSVIVEPEDATDKTVRWESSNPQTVSVDNGIIRGLQLGEAVITVTSNSRNRKDSCTVKVMEEVIEDDFVIDGQALSRPVADVPDSQPVKKWTRVSLSCVPSNAHIYYTLDGTKPVGDYTGKNGKGTKIYYEPITISENSVINVKAVLYGYKSSEATFSYTVDEWGDVEKDETGTSEYFGDNPDDIPRAVWFAFKGDANSPYLPGSSPQITTVSKDFTGGKIIFNDEISVFYGTDRLVEGRDYRVIYRNNVNPAPASQEMASPAVMIKGIGNYYKGSSEFRFAIVEPEEPVTSSDVRIACLNNEAEYTGSRLTLEDLYRPDSKLGYDRVTLYTESGGERVALVENEDYTFDRGQLRDTGTFDLKFVLKGKYSGTVISDQITVKPYNVKKHIRSGDSKVKIDIDKQTDYCKSGAEPKVTVSFGTVKLREGIDYRVTYSRNKKLVQNAKAKIIFSGCFVGTVTEYFETVKKDVSSLSVYADDIKWKDRAGNFKTLPRVLDNEKAVSKLKDIEKFSLTDGCEYYYASGDHIGDRIDDTAIVKPGTVVEVRVSVKSRPSGPYTSQTILKGYYRVYAAENNIRKAVIITNPIDYDEGNAIIPVNKKDFWIKMPDSDGYLDSEYFEIVSVTRNRFIGTATVQIRGRNGYGGTRTFRIKIRKRSLYELLQ